MFYRPAILCLLNCIIENIQAPEGRKYVPRWLHAAHGPHVCQPWCKVWTALPIPVAARSKAYVCGPLITETAGSNSAESIDVRLLFLFCVVWVEASATGDHCPVGCVSLILYDLGASDKATWARVGLLRHRETEGWWRGVGGGGGGGGGNTVIRTQICVEIKKTLISVKAWHHVFHNLFFLKCYLKV